MSVLMTMVIPGDDAVFRAWVDTAGDALAAVGEAGKAAGCIHHRFGAGEGVVIVLDEWESEAAFHAFFEANAEQIEGFMREGGASGPPQITFYDAIATADEF